MLEARKVSFPSPNIEVKVVLPIAFRSGALPAHSVEGRQGQGYAEHQEIGPNRFARVHGGDPLRRRLLLRRPDVIVPPQWYSHNDHFMRRTNSHSKGVTGRP